MQNEFYIWMLNTTKKIKYALSKIGNPFFTIVIYLILGALTTVALIKRLLIKIKLILLKIQLIKEYRLTNSRKRKSKSKLFASKNKKIKWIFILCSLVVLTPIFGMILIWRLFLTDLPSPHSLTTRHQEVSTKIYDKNGQLLYKIYENKNRTPIPLSEIPQSVQLATIAAEDADFYTHPGFSIKGITRAIIHNWENKGELTGGSTITQQLVKNTLLSSEKTYRRKLREVVLAFLVEWTFNKYEILEMYLNEVSYGGTAYGIEEAARYYFDKSAKDLNLSEASLLAGLPKSPTVYSPFGQNPNYAQNRQKEVLKLMYINGYITDDVRKKAESTKLHFAQNRIDIKAPHFVIYTRELLEERFGKELVQKGGLEVTTTVDYSLQEKVQQIVQEEVKSLANLNVGNGAAVVLDSESGEVLAMVGSIDYFDTLMGGNVNMAIRPRQPGSSIKIVNYTYALTNGKTAASIIQDSPITFNVEGQQPYTPRNYSGTYSGNMTLRDAFAQSKNIPAVRVLNEFGVNSMIEQGNKMGITTWNDSQRYGLSLTLGGGEVRLVDLARVYATIANSGKRPPLSFVKKITNQGGKVIYSSNCDDAKKSKSKDNLGILGLDNENGCGVQVIDPRVAFIITDILKDNNARTPVFGRNSQLVISSHPEVAVKTGTSNNLKDNLTVGYTKDYTVAVWVGNNDNSPMSRIASGVTGASTIFNKIMTHLLADKNSYEVEAPSGLIQLPICPFTGTLACSGCSVKQEWFLEENRPTKACSPEWFNKEREGQILPEAASTENTN